jgi:hypothetical protein
MTFSLTLDRLAIFLAHRRQMARKRAKRRSVLDRLVFNIHNRVEPSTPVYGLFVHWSIPTRQCHSYQEKSLRTTKAAS